MSKPKAKTPVDPLLTKTQQAAMLGMSPVTLWRLENKKNNGLPREFCVGPGGRKTRLHSEMLQYVERHRVK